MVRENINPPKWKHKPKHKLLPSVSKTVIIMSSEDSNLQVQSLTKKHLHIYQLNLTETENLASDFYLFGVEKSVVHMLGLRQYLYV